MSGTQGAGMNGNGAGGFNPDEYRPETPIQPGDEAWYHSRTFFENSTEYNNAKAPSFRLMGSSTNTLDNQRAIPLRTLYSTVQAPRPTDAYSALSTNMDPNRAPSPSPLAKQMTTSPLAQKSESKLRKEPAPDGTPGKIKRRKSQTGCIYVLVVLVGLACIIAAAGGAIFYVLSLTKSSSTSITSTITTSGPTAASGTVNVPPAVNPVEVPIATSNPPPLPPPFPPGVNPITTAETGVYLGATLDYGTDTPALYNARMALPQGNVNTFMAFLDFPIASLQGTLDYLTKSIISTMPADGYLILSVEPSTGLASVTAESAAVLAELCRQINVGGTRVLVRFAHEMNGGWYQWGGQPVQYVPAWRLVTNAIRAVATRTAMLWNPNPAGAYPWVGGPYWPAAGSANALALDTNGDGAITAADNPFSPYYPGDEYVDYIGASLFYFTATNALPPANYFEGLLIGATPVQNLYTYAVSKNKPVVIAETGVLHRNGIAGQTALAQKQNWWRQVITTTMWTTKYPAVRFVLTFEVNAPQQDYNNEVSNFGLSMDTAPILAAFKADWTGAGWILSAK